METEAKSTFSKVQIPTFKAQDDAFESQLNDLITDDDETPHTVAATASTPSHAQTQRGSQPEQEESTASGVVALRENGRGSLSRRDAEAKLTAKKMHQLATMTAFPSVFTVEQVMEACGIKRSAAYGLLRVADAIGWVERGRTLTQSVWAFTKPAVIAFDNYGLKPVGVHRKQWGRGAMPALAAVPHTLSEAWVVAHLLSGNLVKALPPIAHHRILSESTLHQDDKTWTLDTSEYGALNGSTKIPDLLVHDPDNGNAAIEVERSRKSDDEYRAIMRLYASSSTYSHLIYVAGSPTVHKALEAARRYLDEEHRKRVTVLPLHLTARDGASIRYPDAFSF